MISTIPSRPLLSFFLLLPLWNQNTNKLFRPHATSHSTSAAAESLSTQVNKSWETFFFHTNLFRNCSTVEHCVWSTKKKHLIKRHLDLKSSLFRCQKKVALVDQGECFISLDTFKTDDDAMIQRLAINDCKTMKLKNTVAYWQRVAVFSFTYVHKMAFQRIYKHLQLKTIKLS